MTDKKAQDAAMQRATSFMIVNPRELNEPTLNQLFAEPIVQQLMGSDGIDEATTRNLLRQAADRLIQKIGCMPPRSRAQGDPTTTVRLLYDATQQWRQRYDREVRRRIPGMTRARCAVLIHLAHYGGINQTALARNLGIRPITLVRLLDRLEAAGFVTRRPDPRDRRAHRLMLTAKARLSIERIYDLAGKISGEAQLGISETEASQLRALLFRIRSNLVARAGSCAEAVWR